jgi:hypothetical protein
MRRFVAAVAVVLSVLATSCAGDGTPRPLQAVPTALIPASLEAGGVTVTEFTGAADGFAQAGDLSLVADGRLYELRRGDVLIGTLEIATLKPKVRLNSRSVQDQIRNQAVNGQLLGIGVEGVPVTVAKSAEKVAYFWFGPQLFELLIIKDPKDQSEPVLRDLIRHQRANGLADVVVDGATTTTRRTRRR